MTLLDDRIHQRELNRVNDDIIDVLHERVAFWQRLAVRDIGRAWFYRELCELQQRTLSTERATATRRIEALKGQISALHEEIACRSGVTKERP